MGEKTLKYLMIALGTLAVYCQTVACPTCVGRLRLGIKKPFFKLYKPYKKVNKSEKKSLSDNIDITNNKIQGDGIK